MSRILIFLFAICSSSHVRAQFPCPSNLPFTLTGNTQYCVGSPGSQLTIEETYDQYEWLPTTETSQSVLLTAGSYQLVLTHYTGCTDTIDIEIEQVSNPPQPTISASGPTEFCAGESVTLSGPPGYPYYEWSTGSVSEEITLYESITVLLSVQDWIGCESSSNSLDVVVNPLPQAIVSPDINGYDVEFNNLSVNATGYEWNFGDGNISTDFEPAHSYALDGEVDMFLVATNNCGSDTAFINLTNVSVNESISVDDVKVFPNPSAGVFNLQLNRDKSFELHISIYSADGKLVATERNTPRVFQDTQSLDLSHLPDGVYLVHLNSDGHSKTSKVLIQRY